MIVTMCSSLALSQLPCSLGHETHFSCLSVRVVLVGTPSAWFNKTLHMLKCVFIRISGQSIDSSSWLLLGVSERYGFRMFLTASRYHIGAIRIQSGAPSAVLARFTLTTTTIRL